MTRTMTAGGVAALTAMTIAAGYQPEPAAKPAANVSVAELLHHLGFKESQQASLLKGDVLSTGLPGMEKENNELAVSAVMLFVRRPLAEVVNAYMDGEVFRLDTDMIEFHQVNGTSEGDVKEQFAGLAYASDEAGEARTVKRFKGGSNFNLSENEIGLFQRAEADELDLVPVMSATWREVLVDRFLSYQAKGLDGIPPYFRSARKQDAPGKELTVATASMTLLRDVFPDFYDAILTYPQPVNGDQTPVEHRLFWLKQRVQGRPCFALTHHASDFDDGYAIVLEQQFYVSHSYNSLEAMLGCLPHEGGTIVFYTNRTFTDQVTGFAAGIARSIGRGRIEESVSKHLQKLRAVLEASPRQPGGPAGRSR